MMNRLSATSRTLATAPSAPVPSGVTARLSGMSKLLIIYLL
jgi:hypothetical protein